MSIHRFPVLIPAEGRLIAGRIHRNTDDPTEPQPGVVASGSWLTVKERWMVWTPIIRPEQRRGG